jgi:plasmid maintenance system antidote protein VapI
MTQILTFSQSDFIAVVEQLKRLMKFSPSDAELTAAFSKVTPLIPDTNALRRTRALLAAERPKLMSELSVRLGRNFDTEPTILAVTKAVEQIGYSPNRRRCRELLEVMRAQNAERWASTAATRKVKKMMLVGGDEAMWMALQKLYELDRTQTASMLLRLFVMSVQTGKVDYLEVPYLTTSLTDKDMQQFAQSLNFKLPKMRRTRG